MRPGGRLACLAWLWWITGKRAFRPDALAEAAVSSMDDAEDGALWLAAVELLLAYELPAAWVVATEPEELCAKLAVEPCASAWRAELAVTA